MSEQGGKTLAPTPAPAIGYSIVSNLGGDRQMTVQCFVGEDEADRVIHAKIDRIFRVVDRQKARYELVDLREERIKTDETLAQFKEDFARVEQEHAKAQAARDVEIVELQKVRGQKHQAGYSAHVATGRQGAYNPKGTVKVDLDRIDAGVQQLVDQKAKAEAEREQHVQSLNVSMERYTKALEALDAKVAARKALLGEE